MSEEWHDDRVHYVDDGNYLAHRRPPGSSAGRAAAMELDAVRFSDLRPSSGTIHINKVHHVTTINRVADDLGEDEDWLRDVANEMDAEDGLIWVSSEKMA